MAEPRKTRYPFWLLGSVAAGISIVGTLVLLELVLRHLPVRSGLEAQTVNREHPVFRYAPHRAATFSRGWNLVEVNRIRTNNDGFVNLQDYDRGSATPLLAIMGDSYVEALMVPQHHTVHARLQQHFGPARRVYTFAASGAGLAQYLCWARYARDTYRPRYVLFSIIANDFAEALWSRERRPGLHAFRRVGAEGWEMALEPYEPGPLRPLARKSALLRYLVLNLQVAEAMRQGLLAAAAGQHWVGNVAAAVDDGFYTEALWGMRVFLDQVPAFTGLPPERILFSIDGIRPQLYGLPDHPAMAGSYWERIRAAFIVEARARGHEVIDLQKAFKADYARNGRRFELDVDTHWNGEGHRVLFEAVRDSETLRR